MVLFQDLAAVFRIFNSNFDFRSILFQELKTLLNATHYKYIMAS